MFIFSFFSTFSLNSFLNRSGHTHYQRWDNFKIFNSYFLPFLSWTKVAATTSLDNFKFLIFKHVERQISLFVWKHNDKGKKEVCGIKFNLNPIELFMRWILYSFFLDKSDESCIVTVLSSLSVWKFERISRIKFYFLFFIIWQLGVRREKIWTINVSVGNIGEYQLRYKAFDKVTIICPLK